MDYTAPCSNGATCGGQLWQDVCNYGYFWDDGSHQCVRVPQEARQTAVCTKGDPCDAATGNEHRVEVDYQGTGPSPLTFTRTYNSMFGGNGNSLLTSKGNIGANWTSNYGGSGSSGSIYVDTVMDWTTLERVPDLAEISRANGETDFFWYAGGSWVTFPDSQDTLSGAMGGPYTFAQPDGTVETYVVTFIAPDTEDETGVLTRVTAPNGLSPTFSYDPTTHLMMSVSDPFGHTLSFTYDSQGRISTLTDPDGNQTTYGYDANNNLSTVTYPDGKVKTYLYNEQACTQNTNLPNALTGIIDENGNRYATFYYNASGQEIENTLAQTTNSAGQAQYLFNYDSSTQTTVTDAVGTREVLSFSQDNYGLKNLRLRTTYDASGNPLGTLIQIVDPTTNQVTCRVDEVGNTTLYGYSGIQLVSMTEGDKGGCGGGAYTTSATRTTSYSYLSPTLNLLTEIDRPSVDSGQTFKTLIGYSDPAHPLLPTSITQSGYTPSGTAVTRTVGMSYTAAGQLATLTDPDGHVTTYSYNNCTSGGGCGELQSITNALSQITNFTQYDGAGDLTQRVDPNGLLTAWNYDQRERMDYRLDNGGSGVIHLINYAYWPSGQPGSTYDYYTGLKITNHYDAAQELYQTNDNLGEKSTDTYDANGNLTNISTYNSGGSLADVVNKTYDPFNHVASVTTPDGTTDYSKIDPLGNILQIISPDQVASGATNINTQNTYDALNRLFQTVDRAGGITTYSYDVNDHLKSVDTPNGATTSYVVDDLGNVLQESSPDRGVTTYTYDNAGNLTSKTDARGIATDYTYDALNRLATVTYPADTSENVTYTYDNCAHGIGRLCAVTDESGTTSYSYDAFGHVASKAHPVNSISYTTTYASDPLGVVQSETYPDGRVITYTRDARERITAVTATVNGATVTLLSNRAFRADDQVLSQTWGNGLTESRQYDNAGRLQTQTVGTDTRVYGYDPNGNLTSLQTIPQVDCLGYDNLDRLTQKTVLTASGASCSPAPATPDETFAYDGNGNRTAEIKGSTTTSYGYNAKTNQLTSIGGAAITLNKIGAVHQAIDGQSFVYDNAGRLGDVYQSGGLMAMYNYDSKNLRVLKFSSAGLVINHYDEAGHLLEETYFDGTFVKAYVWADDTPIAMITKDATTGQEVVTYLHTDYDNTPRLATDSTGNIVWRWEGIFGTTTPNPNQVQVDLRYPGQYYDPETGLHYNWNRYYDPSTGRYDQSDPIGLWGGLNTYDYVGGNPASNFDPWGLFCTSVGGTTTCSYPGGPKFQIPRPSGFPDYLGPKGISNFFLYHKYDVRRSLGCASPTAVMQELIDSPTPGAISNPATPAGSQNNANVFGIFVNPVTSYLTTDINTGAPLVVNVTEAGGPLSPGYVARTVTNGVVHTYGEGLDIAQTPWISPVGNYIAEQLLWGIQMQQMIIKAPSQCGCSKQ